MSTDVKAFENARWSSFRQSVEFRHKATLSLVQNGPVLDVGCGDGLLLGMLQEKGIDATGVDLSEEAIKACQGQGFKAELIETGTKLPFPDGAFEYVVMLDILEHVYDPLPFLMEAVRVSKKSVIVGVPNFSSLPARLQVLRGLVPENNRPHKGHIYWFNKPVLFGIARKAGLHVRNIRMNTFSVFSKFASFFLGLFPNVFALSFVVELSKNPQDHA